MNKVACSVGICLLIALSVQGARVKPQAPPSKDPIDADLSPSEDGPSKDGPAHDDCEEKIMEVGRFVHEGMRQFTEQCGLEGGDFVPGAQTMTAEGKAKMCANQACLASTDFAAPTGLKRLLSECPHRANDLNMITPGYNIVSDVYHSWLECPRTGPSNPTAPTKPQCPNHATVSHNCGHDGEMITEDECGRRGCCWEPSDKPNRNWCYKQENQLEDTCSKRCPAEGSNWAPTQREDCQAFLILENFINPDPNIRGEACRQVGCCWDPLRHGSHSPWCFYEPIIC